MAVKIKNHMFFVEEDGKEIACFKSFAMLAEFLMVVCYVKNLPVLPSIQEV